jgi:hypothetical protein
MRRFFPQSNILLIVAPCISTFHTNFTKDKPADIKLTYKLSATGLRDWIYTKPTLWPLSGKLFGGDA